MTTNETLTLLAILLSPVIAVLVSLWITTRQEKSKQKINLFLTLMTTRTTMPMPKEFVDALNTIDVIFHNNKKILEARKELLVSQNTQPFQSETYNKRLLDLLDTISKSLGYKEIKQTDLDTPFIPFTLESKVTQNNQQ